ncbi:MAG: LuxR C-terminal-related transcriptional regulator [Pseudomonadota bacterium]|nr:LuxR C-terminal-related transcriptional regulator [Pseudomonadota bacterium]
MSDMTRERLLQILTELVTIPDIPMEQFESLMRHEVRALIPHQGVVMGYGTIQHNQVLMNDFVAVDYNLMMLAEMSIHTSFDERPILKNWLEHQKPMMLTPAVLREIGSTYELEEMLKFDLAPMLIHGQRDLSGNMSSYFSFSQCSGDAQQACADIAVIMPFLHMLMTRAMASRRRYFQYDLSAKEQKIMAYLGKGYSNKEIAEFLGCSQYTIKNQVSAILKKMNASNRTEAIHLFNQIV